jgi:hypothetical protein
MALVGPRQVGKTTLARRLLGAGPAQWFDLDPGHAGAVSWSDLECGRPGAPGRWDRLRPGLGGTGRSGVIIRVDP